MNSEYSKPEIEKPKRRIVWVLLRQYSDHSGLAELLRAYSTEARGKMDLDLMDESFQTPRLVALEVID